MLVGSGTGAVTPLSVGTNGQVLIGSGGADPVFAAITDGDGLTSTLGAGTLEFDLDAALTTVTSFYKSSLVLGYGASDANIDFSTVIGSIFDIEGSQQIKLLDGVFQPIWNRYFDLCVYMGSTIRLQERIIPQLQRITGIYIQKY